MDNWSSAKMKECNLPLSMVKSGTSSSAARHSVGAWFIVKHRSWSLRVEQSNRVQQLNRKVLNSQSLDVARICLVVTTWVRTERRCQVCEGKSIGQLPPKEVSNFTVHNTDSQSFQDELQSVPEVVFIYRESDRFDFQIEIWILRRQHFRRYFLGISTTLLIGIRG